MSWVLALPVLIPFVTAVLAFLLRGSRIGELASVAIRFSVTYFTAPSIACFLPPITNSPKDEISRTSNQT